MKRRDFIKSTSAALVALNLPSQAVGQELTTTYDGPILVTYFCAGGIDVSSWVDPKADESVNHWARDNVSYGESGNIRYAPMAQNAAFFNKYAADMLAINGINLNTNSHVIAGPYNAAGSRNTSMPHICELFAAINGDNMALPYISSGGVSHHAGLVAKLRVPRVDLLRTITEPNVADDGTLINRHDYEIIQRAQKEKLEQMVQNPLITRRLRDRANELLQSLKATNSLKNILVPDQLVGASNTQRNMDLFLTLARDSMSVAGTFGLGGFDTHRDHDNRMPPLLTTLTGDLDFLWERATALGVADRLVVLVSSDVGRRPFYNPNPGKDHYSASSAIIMKKNVNWTNRVVGYSGPKHEKLTVDGNLNQADKDGVAITPEHVHMTLRNILGIDQHELSRRYSFGNVDPLPLLHSGGSTGYL